MNKGPRYFQKGRHSGRSTGRPANVEELMPRGTDKKAWLSEYKTAAGCADCGYNEHAVALDFDHVRGEKFINLSVAVERKVSWRRIFDEIEKCEVVCANCHRVRTKERRDAVATAYA